MAQPPVRLGRALPLVSSRRYFKRVQPPSRLRPDTKNTKTIIAGFNRSGSVHKAARRMAFETMAENIVNVSRTFHINMTMGNMAGVNGWKQWRARGSLTDRVAIVVDGSPTRKIANVRFAGRIDIVAEADLDLLIEAATFAYDFMVRHAAKFPKGPGYAQKKNNNYSYQSAFQMFVSDQTAVDTLGEMARMAETGFFTNEDWISIANPLPYAAKLERYRYPNGTFWEVFKQLRRKYGQRLAIRWDYVESVQFTQAASRGSRMQTPIPVIRIGQPGAFPSRAAKIAKYTRDRPVGKGLRGRQ